MLTVILTALVVLIQLADFYLCYLSFREELTVTERRSLWLKFALCGVVFGIIFGWAFARFGISAPLYKFILMTGWLPWLAIQILSVRRELTQHFFVFSMMKIWCVMQHNWAAIIAVLVGLDAPQLIIVHAVTYLLLFVLCLRIERRFFAKMLPPKKFFDDYGKIVAVLPLVMIFGVLILWAQEPLIHTWQERFSRFYLPFVFFFIYRHIMLTTEQLQEQRRTEQNLRRTKDQLAALGEYNRLMQESGDAVAVMRHDLRHSYRLLYMMLLSGKVDAAKDYLEAQEKSLGKTVVKSFCKPPLLNAALSVYLSRAESLAESATKSTCRKSPPIWKMALRCCYRICWRTRSKQASISRRRAEKFQSSFSRSGSNSFWKWRTCATRPLTSTKKITRALRWKGTGWAWRRSKISPTNTKRISIFHRRAAFSKSPYIG